MISNRREAIINALMKNLNLNFFATTFGLITPPGASVLFFRILQRVAIVFACKFERSNPGLQESIFSWSLQVSTATSFPSLAIYSGSTIDRWRWTLPKRERWTTVHVFPCFHVPNPVIAAVLTLVSTIGLGRDVGSAQGAREGSIHIIFTLWNTPPTICWASLMRVCCDLRPKQTNFYCPYGEIW